MLHATWASVSVKRIGSRPNIFTEVHKRSHMGIGAVSPLIPGRFAQTTRYALYQERYFGSNATHFAELLAEHENIHLSVSSVRRILLEGRLRPARCAVVQSSPIAAP